jgi:hypothetical protein
VLTVPEANLPRRRVELKDLVGGSGLLQRFHPEPLIPPCRHIGFTSTEGHGSQSFAHAGCDGEREEQQPQRPDEGPRFTDRRAVVGPFWAMGRDPCPQIAQ